MYASTMAQRRTGLRIMMLRNLPALRYCGPGHSLVYVALISKRADINLFHFGVGLHRLILLFTSAKTTRQ
jgi:hypothetical protein